MKNSDLKRLYGKDNMPNKDGFPRLNEKGELDVPVSSAAIVPPADVPEGKVMASNGQGGTKWVDDVSGTPVEANPETTGSETKLTSIKIDDTKYILGGGDVTSVNGKTGAVTLTKSDVGLNNVNNTADLNKPISTATQEALNGKQATLVSGTNIKTINNSSILGSGNIDISGGSSNDRYFECIVSTSYATESTIRDMESGENILPAVFSELIERNIWDAARSSSTREVTTYHLYYKNVWYELSTMNILESEINGSTPTFPYFSYSFSSEVRHFIKFYNKSSYIDLPLIFGGAAYYFGVPHVFSSCYNYCIQIRENTTTQYACYDDDWNYILTWSAIRSILIDVSKGNEKLRISYDYNDEIKLLFELDSADVRYDNYLYNSTEYSFYNKEYKLTITRDQNEDRLGKIYLDKLGVPALNFNNGIQGATLNGLYQTIIEWRGSSCFYFDARKIFSNDKNYQDLWSDGTYFMDHRFGNDLKILTCRCKVGNNPTNEIFSIVFLQESSGSGSGSGSDSELNDEEIQYSLYLRPVSPTTYDPIKISERSYSITDIQDLTYNELLSDLIKVPMNISDGYGEMFGYGNGIYHLQFLNPYPYDPQSFSENNFVEINFARLLNAISNEYDDKMDHFDPNYSHS